MSDFDLVVAGGGFSGLMAAVFAARLGKKTLLITKGSGVLAIGGGTVDVLGYLPDGTPLASPFPGLTQLPPRHPYSLVGAPLVREALDAFRALTSEENFPYLSKGEANTRVVTALGSTKPSYLTPESMSMQGLAQAKRVHIVGVRGLKDFTPAFIAQGLASRRSFAGKDFSLGLLPNPFALQRDLSSLDLARYLDTDEGLRWLVQGVLERIGGANGGAICGSSRGANGGAESSDGGDMVLVPPLLGTRAATAVHSAVRQGLGRDIYEVVGLPPAVTGLRLHDLLLRLLKKFNVELIEQATVSASVLEKGHCLALTTRSGGKERRYRGKAFIIATGGVLGDGLRTSPTRSWEPIFNLNLPATAADPNWSLPRAYPSCPEHGPLPGSDKASPFCASPAQHHGFALLGPSVDKALRPLAPDGGLLCDNVFFVGKTLGGYDHASEKSGNGVALASAFTAVRNAFTRG